MNESIEIKDNEVFLPPFVVNNFNPPLPQSQTMDWGIAKLGIPNLHASGLTGKGVKVAVIDTWINPAHPDMGGAVIKSINVTAEATTVAQNGHGQGCAGVIGARNNETGVLGVAPDCQIIAIKSMRETGSGDITEIVKGIDAAIAEGAHIINMSLGTSTDVPAMKAAVKRATDAGILVVCAAGNDGQADSVNYPGKYDQAIAVAASNEAGNISSFSSQGWDVDVAAPGERILTCWKNKGYATVSGTSFAAPYVAGVLALFLEAKLSVTQQRLYDTAIDMDQPGRDQKSGYGLINPSGFIAKYTAPPPPPEDPLGKVKDARDKSTEVVTLLNQFLGV